MPYGTDPDGARPRATARNLGGTCFCVEDVGGRRQKADARADKIDRAIEAVAF